ncbi:hypothetical protein GGI21_004366 [Coemansia aciculifera]|uniref:Uncharacterized protein n=1 Tax=Coemansia aciculifera TaxID=417176 RepID=A0ACC1M9T2_9FUNG|nr:hypothetical protein IWW38_000015 [Coemansia aciculifera]KAJ2903951.1 hypothetical protein GGI21_004366 [Coemansia aciculifera]
MGFSPISASSKPEWVPSERQDGRQFIVTGANRGIGLATATGLAALGAHVILAGHEGSAAFDEAMEAIVMATGCERSSLEFMALDLRSLDSVRQFAQAWAQRPAGDRLIQGLINNAGIAGMPGLSPDGFEMCFQINYLSMFLLTRLLLAYVAPAHANDLQVPRIVCVSSSAHLFTLGLPTSEPYLRTSGGGFFSLRYGESKLCVNSFVRQMQARLPSEKAQIFAVHPGSTASGFWQSFPAWAQRCIASVAQDPARGARTSLYCATEPGLVSGGYYADCALATPSFWLARSEAADLLWLKSCAWTGVSPKSL